MLRELNGRRVSLFAELSKHTCALAVQQAQDGGYRLNHSLHPSLQWMTTECPSRMY
eukprot:m.1294910 g.1294910  ORF g.1294910 m.1294910 type:complete len:56 (-) comp24789_c2_seq19:1225-1392(-)